MAPKLAFSWPTTISTLSHLLCFTLHPYITHHLLTAHVFPHPAALSLIQVSTTAICLWFWSLFGLYRLRAIPFFHVLPLAASAAALALLALFTLATTTLLTFQTARLVSAVVVLSIRQREPLAGLIALASGALLVYDAPHALLIPLCYAVFASMNALLIHPFAARIKASELQLQVLLRSLAAVLLLPTALLLDNLASTDALAALALDDPAIVLVFVSGLIAFLSFVSSRASANTLSTPFQSWLLLCLNLAVFICHFATSGEALRPRHVLGVAGLGAAWLFLAEKRELRQEQDDPV